MKTRKHCNKLISSILLALSMVFAVLFVAVPVEADESQILTPDYTYEEAKHKNYIEEMSSSEYLSIYKDIKIPKNIQKYCRNM